MSETKVPEIRQSDKDMAERIRIDCYRAEADRLEELALENAMLKAELAERTGQLDEAGRVACREKQRADKSVEMLNDADRRLTALLDATEEKDVAGG